MKIILFFLLITFVFIPCLYSDDDYGIPKRTFETGLVHTNLSFSNDFLTFNDVFQETLVFNIDSLKDGLNLSLGAGITPLYFSVNNENRWGFGLALGLDTAGIISLPGSMTSFDQAVNARSDAGGAAFIGAEIPVFFHISRLKVKVNPSVFYPLMFIDPDISYTNRAVPGGTELDLRYNLRVYTPFSLESGNWQSLSAIPGVDINLGVEFPISDVLGLTNKLKILNFKIGADFYNVPVLSAQLNNFMEVRGRVGSDEPINILDDGLGGILDNVEGETNYGNQTVGVYRPFKMQAWADWQPFGKFLHLIPTVGFAVSPYYTESFLLEGGLKTRLDLGNVFIATLGVGYYDRLWMNSVDLALNFRFMEINLGLDMRSYDLINVLQGGGYGVNFGLKFGW